MTIATVNPANGRLVRSFIPLTEPELDARLQCAAETFLRYRRTPVGQRARMLLRAAEILEAENGLNGIARGGSGASAAVADTCGAAIEVPT